MFVPSEGQSIGLDTFSRGLVVGMGDGDLTLGALSDVTRLH